MVFLPSSLVSLAHPPLPRYKLQVDSVAENAAASAPASNQYAYATPQPKRTGARGRSRKKTVEQSAPRAFRMPR